jgi:hypothetical protein
MIPWEDIGATLRWAVTTLAAFGTPIIAYLVYKLNKNNSEFSRAEAKRGNSIELNKIKLALLDKRIDFIQRFEQLYNSYSIPGGSLGEFVSGVEDLRDLSRAIFRHPVQEDFDRLWKLAHRIEQQSRKADRLWEKEDPRAEEAEAEKHSSLDELYSTKDSVLGSMYSQTRIDIFDIIDP